MRAPLVSLLSLAALAASAQPAAPQKQFLRARLGDLATAQLYAEGVASLAPADQRLAWHLSMAAHAGEPIHYDQLGWNNLAAKRLLEAVYLFGLEGKPGSAFDAQLTDYLARFYGNFGNHDANTSHKFVPAFTSGQLEEAALRAFRKGADFGVKDEGGLEALLAELRPTLFDMAFETWATTKDAPAGSDIVSASSNTLYGADVKLSDLAGFVEKNPLNSRVVKRDGTLFEEVFRAGTADGKVQPGLYARELGRVNEHLAQARRYARGPQRTALGKLIRYFQTGDLRDWDAYNIAWLRSDPKVDANLGFIETYIDERGQKGEWEALVNYKDEKENRVMAVLARRAQYFEDRMPWPDKYKRKGMRPPVAKAIDFIDAYPTPPAGINLPNEQHLREKFGSKSVLVMNAIEASQAIKRTPLDVEFSMTAEEKAAAESYGPVARKLMVAFHEVTGHGSGKKDAALKGNPSEYLKEYDNTLEEARADLVALWLVFDPALKEMGYPDYRRIGEQLYRSFVIEALSNLRLVERSFEEDHQRGSWMILNWLIDHGAVELTKRDGRTYVRVKDYPRMREAVGELLSRLMVIKATGDHAGIKKLVDETGVHFDPKLRDEVAARTAKLEIPRVILMISPQLVPTVDAKGNVQRVTVHHEQPFLEQQLLRSLLSDLPPAEAAKVAAKVGIDRAKLLAELRTRRSRAGPPPAGAN